MLQVNQFQSLRNITDSVCLANLPTIDASSKGFLSALPHSFPSSHPHEGPCFYMVIPLALTFTLSFNQIPSFLASR